MNELNISQMFIQGLQGVGYALVVFLFMYLAKLWRDAATPFDDDHEVVEKSNLAVGLRRFGLYLGIAIGMSGALSGASLGFWNDIQTLMIDGVAVLVFMMIAQWTCNKFMLHSVDNDAEVLQGNAAVGFLEAGSYIASGFILNGAFSGAGGGFMSALLFFALGQFALLLLFWAYEGVTTFSVVDEIGSIKDNQGNVAAGVAVGGMLVALGIILRSSIAGDFTGWANDMTSFAVSAVVGIFALMIFRALADKLFLPNTSLHKEIVRDRNVAALVLTEGVIIAVAVIVSSAS